MPQRLHDDLSKRERQVMTIIYNKREASARDILNALPKPPSYSAVRSILYVLKKKGLLNCKKTGKKNIYYPTISHHKAMQSAVKHILTTYFDDSVEKAVTAILTIQNENLTERDFDRLATLVDKTKKEKVKRHD